MKKSILSIFILSILFVSCSKDKEEPKVEETIETIATFKDIELKLADSDKDEYGTAFSASTGKTYKLSEISADNIAEIDIVSFNLQAFIAFDSPSESDVIKEIEGNRITLIQHTEVSMTAEEFGAIVDDSSLKGLTVTNDNEALPIDYRDVILFKTADDKIGAMKINALNFFCLTYYQKVVRLLL